MKTAAAGITLILLFTACTLGAQTQAAPAAQRVQVAAPNSDLNTILLDIQKAAGSANTNIGRLRIEKWKTDSDQKKQLLQIADSLQKNITNAVPGLINDVQTSKGGVLASFKLYHNVNVLYEFLNGLSEAAGAFGKKEEYEPLAADASALDTARGNLSTYIEQAANRLEIASRTPAPNANTQPKATVVPGKKVVIEDDEETPKPKKKAGSKSTKKKTSTPAATPPAQSSATPQATPH
jgi:hypothetical protein